MTIEHTLSGPGSGENSDYYRVKVADVVVTITDDDSRGVNIIPTTLTLFEGESVQYSVALNSQPTAIVTVMMTVDGGGDPGPELDEMVLELEPNEWDMKQTVTSQCQAT